MPEYEFSRSLGNTVKLARGESKKTQLEVATRVGVDVRTILNIENFRGNPKMQVIYPLVRSLNIDPRDIFYPEHKRERPTYRQLQLLLCECNEEEAEVLLPVCKAVLEVLRAEEKIAVKSP